MLSFTGARGVIFDPRALLDTGRKEDPMFQMISPSCIHGEMHIVTAFGHVQRRLENGTVRTRSPSFEILLCLAATDQIGTALDILSVDEGDEEAILIHDAKMDIDTFLVKNGLEKDYGVLSGGKDQSPFNVPPDAKDIERWVCEAVNLSQL